MMSLNNDYIVNKHPQWKRNKTANLAKKNNQASVYFRRGIFYFLLFAFVGVTVYSLIFSPFLRITNIVVEGERDLSRDELTNFVRENIEGKYLGILPKNNYIYTFPVILERKLADNYKKINTIEVEKEFPSSMKVKITERKSLLLWCSGEKCYFVDESGYAYADVDFNSPEIEQNHFIKIIELDGKTSGIGQQVMDADKVKFCLSLREAIQGAGLNIVDEFKIKSRLAEDFTIQTTEGVSLLVNNVISVEKTSAMLKTFMQKMLNGSDINTLEYIDLRVENKVFYKQKGSEEGEKKEESSNENNDQEQKE